MVADIVADMEVHMVADTEVDKVADMVADIFFFFACPSHQIGYPFFLLFLQEEEERESNLMRELVTGVG